MINVFISLSSDLNNVNVLHCKYLNKATLKKIRRRAEYGTLVTFRVIWFISTDLVACLTVALVAIRIKVALCWRFKITHKEWATKLQLHAKVPLGDIT